MTIVISLFGAPRVLHAGVAAALPRRKTRALLYYLAARHLPTPREQLLDLFWPNLSRASAQQSLRSTLHTLRAVLGDAVQGSDSLEVGPGVIVDLWQLDGALAAPAILSQLSAGLAVYVGPFLQDVTLPDVPVYDDWVVATREHYQRAVSRGLRQLADGYADLGQFDAAIDAIERAIALDPLQEDVQRIAMRLQYSSGDRVGAIRRYERLRELLDAELGVPPMPETQSLYTAIVTDRLPERPPPPTPARPLGTPIDRAPSPNVPLAALPFVGRAAELAVLRAAVANGELALVDGEAGIGKTRLLDEAERAGGWLLLRGVAHELDSALPYQPLIEALQTLVRRRDWPLLRAELPIAPLWLAEVARLAPELTRLPGGMAFLEPVAPPDESRLREGLAQLLGGLALRGSVVLALDDAQWADTATLGLFGYLARRRMPGVGLIVLARGVAAGAPLAGLIGDLTGRQQLRRIELQRIDDAAIATLLGDLGMPTSPELGAWLTQHSGGNPYFVGELLHDARERGLIDAYGRATPKLFAQTVIPPTVYALIVSRVQRLSAVARRVLDVAAVLGHTFECSVVAHVAALSDDTALDALDELMVAGMVHPVDAERFSFAHSLVMEVVAQLIGEARQRVLHRRTAEALAHASGRQLDERASAIVGQYLAAGLPAPAAPHALRAARAAAQIAGWSESIHFYIIALDGIDPSERAALLAEVGAVALLASDVRTAERVFGELIRDTTRHNEAAIGLAQALLIQSRYAELVALVAPLAQSDDLALRQRAETLWGTAISLMGGDLNEAAAHLEAAAALCSADRDPAVLAHMQFELGGILAQRGDLPGAIARYRQTLVTAAGVPAARSWTILAHNNLAYHLLLAGALDEAATEAVTALRLVGQDGAIGFAPFVHSTLGEIALARGDVRVAETEFRAGLALAERLLLGERIAGLTANLGLVSLAREDEALAATLLRDALARADGIGAQHLAAQIRVWLAPLTDGAERSALLAAARGVAKRGGRRRLLDALANLDNK